jgi:uncharacterized protein
MSIILNFIYFAIAGYFLLVGFLYVFQRPLIYHPEKDIGPPDQYGLTGFEEHMIPTADLVSIQLWHRPARSGFHTIVYFHGNSHHMGGRARIYTALAEKGFGILAVSYRGYGKSSGSPSEEGLYQDGRAALRFLQERLGLAPENTILFGESLGTGVAVQMALEHSIGAIILEAPYTSVAGRAAEIYNFIPVLWLIKDKFDTLKKIPALKSPVLILHGELDRTIPVMHGKALLEAITAPKEAIFFPQVNHNDFDSDKISEHVLDFVQKHKLIHR